MVFMNLWYAITIIGEPELWLISTIFFVFAYLFIRNKIEKTRKVKLKKFLVVIILSVWLTALFVFLLKIFIAKERPCVPCGFVYEVCNAYCPTDSSFPSGHAAIIFAVFVSFFLVFRNKWYIPLFIIPFLVSVSRYFLGVHYLTDIIAGASIGILIPILIKKLYEKYEFI